MRIQLVNIALLLMLIILPQLKAFSAADVVIKRVPAVIERLNQISQLLKQNRRDFSKEIGKLKNRMSKFKDGYSYSIKDANQYTKRMTQTIDALITQDPITAHASREIITNIIRETETILQKTVKAYDYAAEEGIQIITSVEALSKALQRLQSAKVAKGNSAYLQMAKDVANKEMKDFINMYDNLPKHAEDSDYDEISKHLHSIQLNFLITTNPNVIEEGTEVSNIIIKGFDQTIHRINSIAKRFDSIHENNKHLLDPENGKIAKIKARVDALTTPQPLSELLEHPIAIHIEAAATLLRNAKGYATELANENGITTLKLDDGIKETLANHLRLDEYQIERFSLEDLEVALRSFSPEEELAFKEALGDNWRQYLFVIENSKTKDSEQLLSIADLQDEELLQEFVASYLDNLNTIVSEYKHDLPANLLSAHKHDLGFRQILKYSEVYSQHIGKLEAESFLNESRKNFLQALEDIKQANDEDTLLELYDKPTKEFNAYRKAVEDEIARTAKGTDNISKSYQESLRSLFDETTVADGKELQTVLSKTDTKFKTIDKKFNTQTQAPRANTAANQPIRVLSVGELEEDKLQEVRDVITEIVAAHENYRAGSNTRRSLQQTFSDLGWALEEETPGSHPYLMKHIVDTKFKVTLQRAGGDISKGVNTLAFKQIRAVNIVDELRMRKILAVNDLKAFMESEQYSSLGITDKFVKDALDPIRALIGIH